MSASKSQPPEWKQCASMQDTKSEYQTQETTIQQLAAIIRGWLTFAMPDNGYI